MPYKDPEKQKAAQAAAYQKRKAYYVAKSMAWRHANPEKRAEQRRAYKRRHRDKVRESRRRYRAKYPDRVRAKKLRQQYGEYAEVWELYRQLTSEIRKANEQK